MASPALAVPPQIYNELLRLQLYTLRDSPCSSHPRPSWAEVVEAKTVSSLYYNRNEMWQLGFRASYFIFVDMGETESEQEVWQKAQAHLTDAVEVIILQARDGHKTGLLERLSLGLTQLCISKETMES